MSTASRVIINTIIHYARIVIVALAALFSTRYILEALGTEGYGTYDLLAGVIGMLGFITASLTQTSNRFIAVELGRNHRERQIQVFNNCFWLHFGVASGLALLMLSAEFFLFDGLLNIPQVQQMDARWVYRFMVFSMFMTICSTPYSALIIAHENFFALACITIIDALMKLFIAVSLLYCFTHKLLVYGLLVSLISVVNFLCYFFYCSWRYKGQSKISISRLKWEGMKELTGFAGWTFLDTLSVICSRQGYSVLLNLFFGVRMNAAFAVARQVEGQVYTISASVIDSMKPQIMKSEGGGDRQRMLRLSLIAGKFGFSMIAMLVIPLIFTMPDVLSLWLKQVPEGAVLFARLLIIATLIEQLTRGLVYANQAIGKIKWFSVIVSTIRILALPISYVFFSLGFPAVTAIVIFVMFESLGALSRIFVIKYTGGLRLRDFWERVMMRLLLPVLMAFVFTFWCHENVEGLWGIIVTFGISITAYWVTLYFVGLCPDEKEIVNGILDRMWSKIKQIRNRGI